VAQARQTIRKARRANADARIVVTGCAAQIEPQMFAAMDEVDHVVGNAEKMQPAIWSSLSRLRDAQRSAADKIVLSDVMAARDLSLPAMADAKARPRAYVQIQNGCDHRCTFCIIPFGRGNARSLPISEAVTRVRALVEADNGEIVLTGVDLTSYGNDLAGTPRLGTLVKALLREIPELKRLRLSSIDSVEVDADLLDVIASDDRLMPHLHLSLQSGDDLILKRMKRRHERAQAIALCRALRQLRPDIVFGADLIAGFPTESEDMFQRSLDLVEECGLTYLHVFPFSPRPGTPAARMPQVAASIVRERARRLREEGSVALRRHLERELGARRHVLIESDCTGRTEQFTTVKLRRASPPGTIVECTVAGHDGRHLLAA
jgi:threonylcarbamoyladenosine tRNA methylthiotransferase MtaB